MSKIIQKHEKYPNVRNVVIEGDTLYGKLGKFIAQSGQYADSYTESGMLLYQAGSDDPDKAYRISKDYNSIVCNLTREPEFLSKLQDVQPKVLLSEFPMGVLTFQNRVIGQEIPYYGNYVTIHEYFVNNRIENPYPMFRTVLDILTELYDNGIIYTDVHNHNFMVSTDGKETVKPIDFEDGFVLFSPKDKYYEKVLRTNYLHAINLLHKECGLEEVYGPFEPAESFNEIYKQLNAKEYTLVCKR